MILVCSPRAVTPRGHEHIRGRAVAELPGSDGPCPRAVGTRGGPLHRPTRLHDLRHVHATALLLAGTPVHVVATRLGHADPSITLRVYAHVISNQLSEAADTLRSGHESRELAAVSIRVSKKAPSLIGRGL